MFRIDGPTTVRLSRIFPPGHPAWSPARGSDCKPLTHAHDGWPVTGRTQTPGAGR